MESVPAFGLASLVHSKHASHSNPYLTPFCVIASLVLRRIPAYPQAVTNSANPLFQQIRADFDPTLHFTACFGITPSCTPPPFNSFSTPTSAHQRLEELTQAWGHHCNAQHKDHSPFISHLAHWDAAFYDLLDRQSRSFTSQEHHAVEMLGVSRDYLEQHVRCGMATGEIKTESRFWDTQLPALERLVDRIAAAMGVSVDATGIPHTDNNTSTRRLGTTHLVSNGTTESASALHLNPLSGSQSPRSSLPSPSPSPSSQPAFSLDAHVNAYLYGIAIRCRDPRVRRKAIAVMKAANKHEGLWRADLAARIAERIVQLEEEGWQASAGERGERQDRIRGTWVGDVCGHGCEEGADGAGSGEGESVGGEWTHYDEEEEQTDGYRAVENESETARSKVRCAADVSESMRWHNMQIQLDPDPMSRRALLVYCVRGRIMSEAMEWGEGMFEPV